MLFIYLFCIGEHCIKYCLLHRLSYVFLSAIGTLGVRKKFASGSW